MRIKGEGAENFFKLFLTFALILANLNFAQGENEAEENAQGGRNCSKEYILQNCEPFRTYRSCQNGECTCPTKVQPPLLQNNLTIDTYWSEVHRQCVSKLNSVCFYVPPSIMVSQPYRCLVDNAECVQAPDQSYGVGCCKCTKNFHAGEDGTCHPNKPEFIQVFSNTNDENTDDTDTIENSIKSNETVYDTYDQCKWKFQCPHLQECIQGHCECPRNKWHEHGYKIDMIWNSKENICESLEGSYCNNAIFLKPEENMVIKTILKSMLEVRCIPGLNCTDSLTFEIGVCSSANQKMGNFSASTIMFVWCSLVALQRTLY